MIAVDASAILAILLQEPEADTFKQALLDRGGGVMSPVKHLGGPHPHPSRVG